MSVGKTRTVSVRVTGCENIRVKATCNNVLYSSFPGLQHYVLIRSKLSIIIDIYCSTDACAIYKVSQEYNLIYFLQYSARLKRYSSRRSTYLQCNFNFKMNNTLDKNAFLKTYIFIIYLVHI